MEEEKVGNFTSRGPGIKSWRIVIRNLPFDTKTEDVQELAKAFGSVKEVKLPKCKDPKFPNSCAGFCFVQFATRKEAEAAKEKLNFTEFKKRKVAVDWAIDKDRYVTKTTEERERKQASNPQKTVFKEEEESDTEEEDEKEASDAESSTKEEDSDSDASMDSDYQRRKIKKEIFDKKKKAAQKEPRKEDVAIPEGRVVFLRNIDFGTTNLSIKEEASKFGDVSLAIMCKYPHTDQPTGTAFVHFAKKDSADGFLDQLATEEGIEINGRKIFGHRAVPKSDADSLKKNSAKQPKDKRNLHLLRASLVRPGTAQARGMSTGDAQLRERVGMAAKTKLKNLHMFVSPTRLAIHNVPFSFNDEKLREVCLSASKKPDVEIIECRIIRNKQGVDQKGHSILGRSKGFGFVEFSNHTDALVALRFLNNNPDIFTDDKRPVVEFSIENLQALKIKEMRAANIKNPKQFSKKKEWKPTALTVKDSSALAATKRELMAGGKKWLPKKFGEKVRHKNDGKKNVNKPKKTIVKKKKA